MERLSLELISLIASHLSNDEARQCASISPCWQHAVEQRTFSKLKVRSDKFSLFEIALQHAHRRRAVSSIEYEIILPSYSRARCWKRERLWEHEENNVVFSQAIHAIMRVLHAWQTEGEAATSNSHNSRPIQLCIKASSQRDASDLQRKGIGLYRMNGNFLSLTEPYSDVPKVERVKELQITGTWRPLHPEAALKIITSMPNLEVVELDSKQPWPKWEAMIREHRSGRNPFSSCPNWYGGEMFSIADFL